MSDSVFVSGLALHAYHGVMQHEAKVGQTFKLDLMLDIELAEVAYKAGIEHYHRAPALNDRPEFIHALGAIVTEHLQRGETCRSKYPLRCPGCKSDVCRSHAERQTIAAEMIGEAAGD